MEQTIAIDDAVIARLAADLLGRAAAVSGGRYLLGIAGIPGSGKSTLARKLVDAAGDQVARLVPMDGFHFTNRRLEELGLRSRKGSPPTFDFQAYFNLLKQARDAGRTVRFPIYDRDLHEPVIGDGPGSLIAPGIRLVVTEGNYLLVDEPPWRELAGVLDESWYLETPAAAAREWILGRHQRGGRDPADALRHYEHNDAPNAELVMRSMRQPDLRLRWK